MHLARETARRIAAKHPNVCRVLLFGSFAREDYGVRSDLDLLVVLSDSEKPFRARIADFLDDAPGYPTDIFPYTEEELRRRQVDGDPFFARVLGEATQIYP